MEYIKRVRNKHSSLFYHRVICKEKRFITCCTENSNVTYEFVDNPDGAFTIHPVSGKISVSKNLDREIRDEYSLRVRADDGSWKLETVITVTLVDDNDNAPIFDRDFYEFSVPFSKNNISVVGRVHALDRDAPGPNSAVSYSLAFLHDFFNVDEFSGQVSAKNFLSSSLTHSTNKLARLSLVASLQPSLMFVSKARAYLSGAL